MASRREPRPHATTKPMPWPAYANNTISSRNRRNEVKDEEGSGGERQNQAKTKEETREQHESAIKHDQLNTHTHTLRCGCRSSARSCFCV